MNMRLRLAALGAIGVLTATVFATIATTIPGAESVTDGRSPVPATSVPSDLPPLPLPVYPEFQHPVLDGK